MGKIVLCVAGSRDVAHTAQHRLVVAAVLSTWVKEYGMPDEVIHGGCRGIDSMAGEFFDEMGVTPTVYPADWGAYGKRAGPIRNSEMAKAATHLVAIPGPSSKGTRDMIKKFEVAQGQEHCFVADWFKAVARVKQAQAGRSSPDSWVMSWSRRA